MLSLIALLIVFIVAFIILAVSALPLFLAVQLLGGRTGITKAIIVMLLVGLISSILTFAFSSIGTIISFLVSVWIYREFFQLKWIKAFLVTFIAWLLIVLFYFLLIALLIFLGISSAHTIIFSGMPTIPFWR